MKLLKLLSAGATLLGSISADVLSQPDHSAWRYGSHQSPNTPTSMYQKTQEGTVWSLKFNIDKYDGTVYDQKTGKRIGDVHLDCQESCIVKIDDLIIDGSNKCTSQCEVSPEKVVECVRESKECEDKCPMTVCPECCSMEATTCKEVCATCGKRCKEICEGDGDQEGCEKDCANALQGCTEYCAGNNEMCAKECAQQGTPCSEELDVCSEQCVEDLIDCYPPCVRACLEPGEVETCSLEFETTKGNFDITGSFESMKSLISEKGVCELSRECEIGACLDCKSDNGISTKHDSLTRSSYELKVVSLFGTSCAQDEPIFFLDIEFGEGSVCRSLKHSGNDYNYQPQPRYVYQQPMPYNSNQQPMTHAQQGIVSPGYGGQQQWQYTPAQPQYQQKTFDHYANDVQPVYTHQHQHQPVGYTNHQPANYGQ